MGVRAAEAKASFASKIRKSVSRTMKYSDIPAVSRLNREASASCAVLACRKLSMSHMPKKLSNKPIKKGPSIRIEGKPFVLPALVNSTNAITDPARVTKMADIHPDHQAAMSEAAMNVLSGAPDPSTE
jgi:hypothetical protein